MSITDDSVFRRMPNVEHRMLRRGWSPQTLRSFREHGEELFADQVIERFMEWERTLDLPDDTET